MVNAKQRGVGGLCLAASLLVGAYPAYLAYSTLLEVTTAMANVGWYQAIGASEPASFLLRCELNTECRSLLNPLTQSELGLWEYPLWLSVSGVLLALLLIFVAPPPKPFNARFARLGDVRGLIVNPKSEYAIPFVKLTGRWLGIEHDPKKGKKLKHSAIIAPSQKGKSVLAKGILGTFRGSVVAVDIKGELIEDTQRWRSSFSEVYRLDPLNVTCRFNPIAELGTDETSLRAAAALLVTDPKDSDPIFAERAIPAVYAGLFAAQLAGEPAIPFLHELIKEGMEHFIRTLAAVDHPEIRSNLVVYLGTPPELFDFESLSDQKGFIPASWGTLNSRLAPLFDKNILEMFSGSDFRAADLGNHKVSVYLTWPEKLLSSGAKPLALILHGLVTGMAEAADTKSVSGEPTLMLLDEAAQYRIPSLPAYITTLLGRGIAIQMILQSFSQLTSLYRRDAQAIEDNLHVKTYLSPPADAAQRLSKQLGFKSYKRYTYTQNRKSWSWEKRELMTPDELEILPDGEAIFHYAGFRYVRAKRLIWFKERLLKKRLAKR